MQVYYITNLFDLWHRYPQYMGLVKSGKIHTIGPTAGQGDPRTSSLQAMGLVVLSKDSQSNKNTNRSYRAMN